MLKPGFEKHVNLEGYQLSSEPKTEVSARIRARVRFDYRGRARPSRFFFGGKTTGEAAEELRQQQDALWRNVPIQGVLVENMESGELYTVYDEEADGEVVFAPLELTVLAESPAELIRFASRMEFRYLRIMEPERLTLSAQDLERLFFQVHEQTRMQVYLKTRKFQD